MSRERLDATLLLEELTARLIAIYNLKLRDAYGISYSEWKLLTSVFLAQKNPTQEEIARYAMKSPAAVSRQLNYLEKKELVEREVSKDSKRTKLVLLTKTGKNLMNRGAVMLGKFSKGYFKQLGDDLDPFRDCLVELLQDLDNNSYVS